MSQPQNWMIILWSWVPCLIASTLCIHNAYLVVVFHKEVVVLHADVVVGKDIYRNAQTIGCYCNHQYLAFTKSFNIHHAKFAQIQHDFLIKVDNIHKGKYAQIHHLIFPCRVSPLK